MINFINLIGYLDVVFYWIVFTIIIAIPVWKILMRTGMSRGWIILLIIPCFGWLILWSIIAAAKWPNAQPGLME
jgi:hypothetical protein